MTYLAETLAELQLDREIDRQCYTTTIFAKPKVLDIFLLRP